jgi:hypothetical protein
MGAQAHREILWSWMSAFDSMTTADDRKMSRLAEINLEGSQAPVTVYRLKYDDTGIYYEQGGGLFRSAQKTYLQLRSEESASAEFSVNGESCKQSQDAKVALDRATLEMDMPFGYVHASGVRQAFDF